MYKEELQLKVHTFLDMLSTKTWKLLKQLSYQISQHTLDVMAY